METCIAFAPDICVTWKSDLQFWEVGMTAVISALTIVASVFIARSVAKSEVRRERESDRRARRSQVILGFAELATDILHRESAIPVTAIVANFTARVSPLLNTEDFDSHEWMQDAISEMVEVKLTGRTDAGEDARPEHILSERVDDLRGWAKWDRSWEEYLEFANVRPVTKWRDRFDRADREEAAAAVENSITETGAGR